MTTCRPRCARAELLLDSQRIDEAGNRLCSRPASNKPDYAMAAVPDRSRDPGQASAHRARLAIDRTGPAQYPDDLNLLYTRAMLAEKRNDLAQLEADLRNILAREPDNAMALNALGYTLADRTERYDEALQLIELAHQINPQDPAILDSLGWVQLPPGQPGASRAVPAPGPGRLPRPRGGRPPGRSAVGQRQATRSAQGLAPGPGQRSPTAPFCASTLLRLTGAETP